MLRPFKPRTRCPTPRSASAERASSSPTCASTSTTRTRIVVRLLVELYARSAEEATEVLEEATRGTLAITSLAEASHPPASTGGDQH